MNDDIKLGDIVSSVKFHREMVVEKIDFDYCEVTCVWMEAGHLQKGVFTPGELVEMDGLPRHQVHDIAKGTRRVRFFDKRY